jgi:hypothetical protein
MFDSVPLIPKFASEMPQGRANFGIGTLENVLEHANIAGSEGVNLRRRNKAFAAGG